MATSIATGEDLDLRRVAAPRSIDRPAPFWSWNERIEPAEARRQVRELARGGLGGGFIHVRVGLITPYLGDEFMDTVAAAVDECRLLGLHPYLYDEDRWPSGWGGGAVPLRDPSYRSKWLLRVPPGQDAPAGDNVSLLARDPDGTAYVRYVSPLGQAWFSGTTYADLMDRAAMRAFLEVAYEPYAARFGADFGGLIPAIFTDEPAITFLPAYADVPRGMLFWTDELPARFRARHGYDLLSRLAELFEDVGAYTATRTDYYRTCADLFERNFSAQLGAWCRDHGIALTGHYMLEGSLAANLAWDVCTLPHYRHMDWPGIDHLGRQIEEVITGLGCRSVVNQYAKPRMMSELYGCAGQHLSFEDRKWIAEQQIVLGVNLLVPHLLLYTMAGERKRDFPCNMWYQQPWWPQNHVVDDYLGRLCALMSQGEMVPELLVLHPIESLYPLRRPPLPEQDPWAYAHRADNARLTPLDAGFQGLSHDLLALQRSFDYGDETILADAGRVEADGPRPLLRVGAMAYPIVLLPDLSSVRATTLDLLEQFAAAGGPVLSVGALPSMVDGRPDGDGRLARFLGRHVRSVPREGLGDALDALIPPLVRLRGEGAGARRWLWQHTRRVGEQRVVLLANLSRQERVDGTLHLPRMTGPLHRLDLVAGTRRVLAEERGPIPPLSLRLEPGESAVLVAGAGDLTAFAPAQATPDAREMWRRLDEWSVERLDENALTLDLAQFARGDEPLSPQAPVIAIQHVLNAARYDGPLTLRYAFENRLDDDEDGEEERSIRLVLERPQHCEVRVNGTVARYDGLPAWRDLRWLPIEIGRLLRRGENVVELRYPAFEYGDVTSVADQARRYGIEIEAIYLTGDFGVAARAHEGAAAEMEAELWMNDGADAPRGARPVGDDLLVPVPPEPTPPWTLRTLRGPFALVPPAALQPGDLVGQGLPFYAGRVACRARLTLDTPPDGRVWLEAERLSVPVVEVLVNGQATGTLAWRPYRVELTDALRAGANTIELILYHSLRNLLGPHHSPDGEPYWVGPQTFQGRGDGWAERLARGERIEGWRDSYAVTEFGLFGEVRLLREARV